MYATTKTTQQCDTTAGYLSNEFLGGNDADLALDAVDGDLFHLFALNGDSTPENSDRDANTTARQRPRDFATAVTQNNITICANNVLLFQPTLQATLLGYRCKPAAQLYVTGSG